MAEVMTTKSSHIQQQFLIFKLKVANKQDLHLFTKVDPGMVVSGKLINGYGGRKGEGQMVGKEFMKKCQRKVRDEVDLVMGRNQLK